MKPEGNRCGFTLIEVLVASLLLSMLVVILTMVFNQTSIAWRTGRAGVSQMDKMRRGLSQVQRQADNILPGARENHWDTLALVVSPWKDSAWKGNVSGLRKRAIEEVSNIPNLDKSDIRPDQASKEPWQLPGTDFMEGNLGKLRNYIVGVKSRGPDGELDTEDDISTWPVLEVE